MIRQQLKLDAVGLVGIDNLKTIAERAFLRGREASAVDFGRHPIKKLYETAAFLPF
ncbi:MAG: hypothetical protein R3B91_06605 [Planctomycetaceae bacterium]